MTLSAQLVKTRAIELGFNLVGLTSADPSPRLAAYFQWLDAHMYGDMVYMARSDRQARRRDLTAILPGARSLIVVGLDYHAVPLPEATTDPSRGRIAAYAWGADYHTIMLPRLEMLANDIREASLQPLLWRAYVDTGAILERSHAQQAGLGFTGKNTTLINPRRGSFFFLGEIITDAELDEYDHPHRETMCGSCTRCQSACPTQAFPRPYVLDARRCISYLTIENKGWIDQDLRPQMGNWVYGCDICQEVCPFSRFAVPASLPVDRNRAAPPLIDLLRLDETGFKARFEGSAIARIKRDRLVRNACVAAGNWGSDQPVPALIDLLSDPSPLVRGHAAWALGQIGSIDSAHHALDKALRSEPDSQVQNEIQYALEICPAHG